MTPRLNYKSSHRRRRLGLIITLSVLLGCIVQAVLAAPADITLSNTSVPDNSPGGTNVGTFSTTDASSSAYTYTLVDGAGSTDNGSFTITGDTLLTTALFDYETKSVYAIRVRSTDSGGVFFEKQFLIYVTNGPDNLGTLSFSSANYSVTESGGNAIITLKRTGGADNPLIAQVTLSDVTTSAADYVFKPGSLDTSFDSSVGADGWIGAIIPQPDGKILIGGDFTTYNGTSRPRIARIYADGSLDTSFDPGTGASDRVGTLVVQPDGKILVGGQFTGFNAVVRNALARLNQDGSLDTTFDPGFAAGGTVTDIVLQPDGKILVGGAFFSKTGARCLTRLNSDGTPDSSFNTGTGPNVGVDDILLQPDGKILISGAFFAYNGVNRLNLARLNTDGSLDTTFSGDAIGIRDMALQPDGKIIITGFFTTYNGTSRPRIARLNADSSLDTSFDPGTGANSDLYNVILQPDGRIIVVGISNFNRYNGTPCNVIVRINPDGTLDTTFNAGSTGPNFDLSALALQRDGKIFIGGYSTAYNGVPRNHIARLMGDYFIEWDAGDSSDKTITLPIVNDSLPEPDETLKLNLLSLQGGAPTSTPSSATLTIGGNFSSNVSVNNVSVTEGNIGMTPTIFTVSLSAAGSQTVTVDYATANGTATAGSDYQSTSGTLVFAPGETSKQILVNVMGDVVEEADETFVVNLTNATNSNNTSAQGMGTIQNDDTPKVQLSSTNYTVNEADSTGAVTITVIRTGDATIPVTVDFKTSDTSALTPCQTNGNGIASDRCDYATAAGTLRFAAGEVSKSIQIPIIADAYTEPDEVFNITLSNPSNATLGTSTANITITNFNATQPAINPIDSQGFFIRQQYIDFLGRVPEAAGFQFWTERMTNCPPGQVCDRIDTSQRFFQSDEFQERGFYVYRLYDAVLGRLPKYAEFVPDVARLNGPQTVQEQRLGKDAYLLDFINRQEFRNLYGAYLSANGLTAVDAAGFVNALCATAKITPASKQALIDNLQNGVKDPAHTLEDFILTQEMSSVGTLYYDRGFITMQYFGYLRRDPDQGGFNFWVSQLIGENAPHRQDYRFMVGGFLQSDEYRFRFAMISGGP
jgi:uncharacterized delta-60 repeat protein